MRTLIQLSDKDFSAGVVLEHDRVFRAAPILRYMLGWSSARVLKYAGMRGWKAETSEHYAPGARKIEIRDGSSKST